MRLTTHFFKEPTQPGAVPYCFSNPKGDFSSLDEARQIAKASADSPGMQAHSILIASDDGAIHERWVREAQGWVRQRDDQ